MEGGSVSCSRYLCSYPKSGRTWLRFMLATALSCQHSLKKSLDLQNVYEVIPNADRSPERGWQRFLFAGRMPLVACSHELDGSALRANERVVYLLRDPRDVAVSFYFHRRFQLGEELGSLGSFLRSEGGLLSHIRHLESWAPHIESGRALSVSYEQLHCETAQTLDHVAQWLGVRLSTSSIAWGVSAGHFDQMQRRKIASGISGHVYDRNNEDARRVRRGVVGGYVDYLTEEECAYTVEKLRASSDRVRSLLRSVPALDTVW